MAVGAWWATLKLRVCRELPPRIALGDTSKLLADKVLQVNFKGKLNNKPYNRTIIYPLQATSKEEALHELLDYFQSLKYLTATAKLFSYLDSKDKIFNSGNLFWSLSINSFAQIFIIGFSRNPYL